MSRITIKVVLDSHVLSDGKQGLYLRITKNRKSKKINLGLKCKSSHYQNGELKRGHKGYQIDNEIITKMKSKAMQIVRESQLDNLDLSLDDFDKIFRGVEQNKNVLIESFFKEIESELERLGKMSTAKANADTRKSLLRYKKNLTFEKLTPEELEKYEVFMRETGSQTGGVAFRMRHLRALYNEAIKRDKVSQKYYPFDRYKVSKLKPIVEKIALSKEELKAFRDVDLTDYPQYQEAYDYFMFSFYGRGINFHDIMLLSSTNVKNDRINYKRSKTGKQLTFQIIKPLEEIIEKHKNSNTSQYIFPILLSNEMTPQQIKNRKQKVLSRINLKLKEIAKLAKIDKKITFYVARHSFATIQKMLGSPIEKISEMLGHKDVSITMVYLKDFSNEELDVENNKLLDL